MTRPCITPIGTSRRVPGNHTGPTEKYLGLTNNRQGHRRSLWWNNDGCRPAEVNDRSDMGVGFEAAEGREQSRWHPLGRNPSSWPSLQRSRLTAGFGCRPQRRHGSPRFATASRPPAAPTTPNVAGVRRYFVRALATFSGESPCAAIASAIVSPSSPLGHLLPTIVKPPRPGAFVIRRP